MHRAKGLKRLRCHPQPLSGCIWNKMLHTQCTAVFARCVCHYSYSSNEANKPKWYSLGHMDVHFLEIFYYYWVGMRKWCRSIFKRWLMRIRSRQSCIIQANEFMEFLTSRIHRAAKPQHRKYKRTHNREVSSVPKMLPRITKCSRNPWWANKIYPYYRVIMNAAKLAV